MDPIYGTLYFMIDFAAFDKILSASTLELFVRKIFPLYLEVVAWSFFGSLALFG